MSALRNITHVRDVSFTLESNRHTAGCIRAEFLFKTYVKYVKLRTSQEIRVQPTRRPSSLTSHAVLTRRDLLVDNIVNGIQQLCSPVNISSSCVKCLNLKSLFRLLNDASLS